MIFHDSDERRCLLERKFGTVVLDEAHRARRRGGLSEKQGKPNNLLDFIFGGLPDTIEDDWIETAEKLAAMLDQYIHLRPKARDVFELHYKETIDSDQHRWELCARVLARKDVVEKLSVGW